MEALADQDSAAARLDERRGGPRFERSRCAILAAARELFLTVGYNINLDEVAALAGVSKTTLYNHFGTKRILLEAVAYDASDAFIARVGQSQGGEIPDILLRYANEYQLRSLSAEGINFHRLLVADVSKFPDLAATLYERGMGRIVASLAHDLETAMDAGKLRRTDPVRAAERFMGALTGMVRYRAFAGLADVDSPEVRETFIAETVELFVMGLAVR